MNMAHVNNTSSKLWGGRFSSLTDPVLEELNSSIKLDKRLYAEDILGSKAYAISLCHINMLSDKEMQEICTGFDIIEREWNENKFIIKDGDEDIHTANERRLKEIIGEPAAKLHVGRSRNDQVITDVKLWMRSSLYILKDLIKDLIEVFLSRAKLEIDILIPGYTHLQRAQPVRWSHWLLSHAWNFKADAEKTNEILNHVNICPLGSGALAGSPFQINRMELARSLGFTDVTQNSMHAVGDRDFIAEFLFWASLVGVHLSRLAEDLILYNSKEFGFIIISDSYSTGSSLMPQKRNPDSLELIRGIGGTLFGDCCKLMMTLKGLPSTYNKDLQIDKEALFNSYDKLSAIIKVAIGTVKTLQINEINCSKALSLDMLATDLAYYLVRKGVAFREAHHLAGQVVAEAEKKEVFMYDLTLEELKEISPIFDADVSKVWNYENSVEQYETVGGTSKICVSNQIQILENWVLSLNRIN